MPRKSKEFQRRSAASRKGWRTRRRHERERSERAKRGWETRRKEHKIIGGGPGPGGGGGGGAAPPGKPPEEFEPFDDLFYEGFEADEEDEY